jgi:hypothetical protein
MTVAKTPPKGVQNSIANSRRQCRTCKHPARAEIEVLLARGVSRRVLAKRFPDLSADSMYRHHRWHTPESVRLAVLAPGKALHDLAVEADTGLLAQLRRLTSTLWDQFDAAAAAGDRGGVSALGARILAALELQAKRTGELLPHATTVNNNLMVSQDFLALRSRLVMVLQRHPEAARDVADIFRILEPSGALPGRGVIEAGKANGEAAAR